ncbi:peptidase S24-like protein [Parvimonas micra ATCC 33270]|uniref:Peptidase S24-like protein n=3 Tax=Peptoniphilaceae TaxID=1570339 RepID=A8SI83_9FIRM|nr:peptidase S24-like protein [Parvimonas micra ATCC 33270]
MTQAQLAKKLGVAPTTVSSWERNDNNPLMDNITLMAEIFDVPVSYFFDKKDGIIVNEPAIEYSVSPVLKTPLYGSIAAGALSLVDPVTESNVRYINLPAEALGKYSHAKGLFALKVNGESMNKVIPNGSYIACKPIEIEDLKDDDIVIFSVDNEYSMKRFRRDDENRVLIFSPESTDRKYHDIVVPFDTPNDLKIYAKVIWYAVTLD